MGDCRALSKLWSLIKLGLKVFIVSEDMSQLLALKNDVMKYVTWVKSYKSQK